MILLYYNVKRWIVMVVEKNNRRARCILFDQLKLSEYCVL